MTINYGLRYEVPSPYTEKHNLQNLWDSRSAIIGISNRSDRLVLYPGDKGVPRGSIPTERDAFAPRLVLPGMSPDRMKFLVTAAYGIFYDPYYTGQGGPIQDPISAPPYLQTPQISTPNFADPYNGQNPFNGGFAQPMTLLVLNPSLRLPYAKYWNLNIEQALSNNWLLQVGYIGTKGTKLPRFIEGNPAVYVPGEVDGQPISNQNNADQREIVFWL